MNVLLNRLLEEEKRAHREEWGKSIGHMVEVEQGSGGTLRRYGFRIVPQVIEDEGGDEERLVAQHCSLWIRAAMLMRYRAAVDFMLSEPTGADGAESDLTYGIVNCDESELESSESSDVRIFDECYVTNARGFPRSEPILAPGIFLYVSNPLKMLVDPEKDLRIEFLNDDRYYTPEWKPGAKKGRIIDAHKIVQGDSKIFVAHQKQDVA